MKPLIEVKHQRTACDDIRVDQIYLRYSREAVARSESLDGEVVTVDYDAGNEVVGISIDDVDDESVSIAAAFAGEHGLGMALAFLTPAA